MQLSARKNYNHQSLLGSLASSSSRFGEIDFLVFNTHDIRVSYKSLGIFKSFARHLSCYVSVGVNYEYKSSPLRTFCLQTIISSDGDIVAEEITGRIIYIETPKGIIAFFDKIKTWNQEIEFALSDSDLLVYSDLNSKNEFRTWFSENRKKIRNSFVYLPKSNSMNDLGATVYGLNGEVISQAAKGWNQAIAARIKGI